MSPGPEFELEVGSPSASGYPGDDSGSVARLLRPLSGVAGGIMIFKIILTITVKGTASPATETTRAPPGPALQLERTQGFDSANRLPTAARSRALPGMPRSGITVTRITGKKTWQRSGEAGPAGGPGRTLKCLGASLAGPVTRTRLL